MWLFSHIRFRCFARVVILAVVLLSLGGKSLCAAAQSHTMDSVVVTVYFRVNETILDKNYRENGSRLDQFVTDYKTISNNDKYKLVSFDVVSSASPEGYHRDNVDLAHGRAMAIIDYVEKFVSLNGVNVNVSSIGNNWDQFRRAVIRSDCPDKATVLRIIDSEPEYVMVRGKETDIRIHELQTINGGVVYEYLKRYIFPNLRLSYAKLVFRYEKVDQLAIAVPLITGGIQKDTLVSREPIVNNDGRKLVFAFKSNLLLPLLNVGFEVPIGNRWSIAYMHYYPWLWRYWPTQSNQYCFEAMWGELDVRYWFGKKHEPGEQNFLNRLQGHSIGLFTQVGYYDIGWDWTGRQGEFATIGVDYLYGLSLAKGALQMQFNIGLGYMYSYARTYDVFEYGGKLYRRQNGDVNINWFGPIRAGVTLVVPIYSRYKKDTEKK